MDDVELTEQEKWAIAALEALAKKWPASLWLFSASGNLHVMRKGEDGKPVFDPRGYVDRDYSIRKIRGIDSDGGDW